jgi:hypothetical protein
VEHPTLISGSTFCKLYSSFWREVAPTTDLFIRRLNLGQYERDFPEIEAPTAPSRRGFINEVAFELFCRSIRRNERWPSVRPSTEQANSAAHDVQSSVSRRERERGSEFDTQLLSEEIADIAEQHDRLMRVFTFYYLGATILPEPNFRGCGIVDTCIGDLLVATTLFEVKAGDRFFRSIDVRQLMTYAALNHVSHQYEIKKAGLFNPRVGIRVEIDLEELCFEISGKKSVELLTEISLALSSGEVSR